MPVFVNNVEISDDLVHGEMQHHPAESVEKARYYAARSLVVQELLVQEAKKLEILTSESKEEEILAEAVEKLVEREVVIPEADLDICEKYYDAHKKYFLDKKTGELLPFFLVKEHIKGYLHTKSLRYAISQYIEMLAAKSAIEGFKI